MSVLPEPKPSIYAAAWGNEVRTGFAIMLSAWMVREIDNPSPALCPRLTLKGPKAA
jgi:hypothetical protein